MQEIYNKLKAHEGVEFVYIQVERAEKSYLGEGTWLRPFAEIVPMTKMWSMRREHPIKDNVDIVIRATAGSIPGGGLVRLAVATPRGHKVNKSIRRMVERYLAALQRENKTHVAA